MKFGADTKVFSKYLKIEPGKSIAGVFRGEPLEYACKEVNKKTVVCDPSDPNAKFRFKINFVIQQKDLTHRAYVWEQSASVYDTLKKFNEDFPLDKTIVKISRDGSGLKTKYSILPNGNKFQVSPELDAALSGVTLIPLKADKEESEALPDQEFPPDETQAFSPEDEIPF